MTLGRQVQCALTQVAEAVANISSMNAESRQQAEGVHDIEQSLGAQGPDRTRRRWQRAAQICRQASATDIS